MHLCPAVFRILQDDAEVVLFPDVGKYTQPRTNVYQVKERAPHKRPVRNLYDVVLPSYAFDKPYIHITHHRTSYGGTRDVKE